MAEENVDEDQIETFELAAGPQPDTFTFYIKSKSEEFDFLIDRETLQELADAIEEKLGSAKG